MTAIQPASVTVDLKPLGRGKESVHGVLEFGALDRPEEISLTITRLKPEQINALTDAHFKLDAIFGDKIVAGQLASGGGNFTAELSAIRNISYDFDKVTLACLISDYSEAGIKSVAACRYWKFRLANYRLGVGDLMTYKPAPASAVAPEKMAEYEQLILDWHKEFGQPVPTLDQVRDKLKDYKVLGGFSRKRITFTFGSRTWFLDDDMYDRWPPRLDRISQPIVSGTLACEKVDTDDVNQIKELANHISLLLTFALGRDVKWISYGCFPESGPAGNVYHESPPLQAFNQCAYPVIENWEVHNVKRFLESAEVTFSRDLEWWRRSIGLLLQGRTAQYLEIKCAILNVLVDRLTWKINGDNYGYQIDPNIEKNLNRKWFRYFLNWLLGTLSKNWDVNRTNALCDKIIEWNSQPSFPKTVALACNHFNVPPITGKKIGFRHKLLHAGELNKELKTSEARAAYLFELEGMVLLLMIRMLQFDGYIYLQTQPPDHRPVGAFLNK